MRSNGLLLPTFALAILVSATLLFLVQPMFTKMVLPLLGGTPAVWNTALVFFQFVLLGGYAYAHVLTRLPSPSAQRVVHLALVVAAIVALPIAVAEGWTPPVDRLPTAWLLALFAFSIGLPFFALSANAPLLQRWFSTTDHPHAADPYFLYAASNVGSIAALLAYPVLIEPRLGLVEQSALWSGGFWLLALLIGACAALTLRRAPSPATASNVAPDAPTGDAAERPAAHGAWRERVSWTLCALVPSSLLLGVTTHLTTDVAVVPLAWIVPLVLYLLTFVNVFARRPLLSHRSAVRVQAYLVILLALVMSAGDWLPTAAVFALHLLAFAASALVCHGELARRRPSAARLTEFYFFMSLGGALGGAFTALLAPLVFETVREYPLAIVAACALRPTLPEGRSGRRRDDLLMPLGLAAASAALFLAMRAVDIESGGLLLAIIGGWAIVTALVVFGFSIRPARFALGIAVLLFGIEYVTHRGDEVLHRERSFFGTHSVVHDASGNANLLRHGSTVHGVQSLDPRFVTEPAAYYSRLGPAGDVFGALRGSGRPLSVGLVGLGTGALLCYRRPEDDWRLFEIDPTVLALARDTRYFHYLERCGGDATVELGDARLSLVREADGGFDLIVLDAFSSDAIPINLVTREAIALYLGKLAPNGVLLFHVSNRYLDLEPVFAAHAAERGLGARVRLDSRDVATAGRPGPDGEIVPPFLPSQWIVVAREASTLDRLLPAGDWQALRHDPSVQVWSDDFSDILGVMRWSGASILEGEDP